jgi:hypothetical protein
VYGIAAALLIGLAVAPARAQTTPVPSVPPPAPEAATFTLYVRDWTRVEMWQFFEPRPGGGDPAYADVATRLQIGVERRTKKYELVGAFQYVQFGALPTDSVGPGPLGTGALYYDQGGNHRDARGLYVRYLNAKIKDIVPGWAVQVGRMPYTSGAESPSGDTKIEAVKRQRVDSKLLGEFEWSLFQRAFDGVRTDVDRPAFHLTAAAFHPTQGGFENNGNVDISDIGVYAGLFAVKPGAAFRHTDWEAFAIRYDDDRAVRARPDNSGRTATRVSAHISTFGTLLTGAYPRGPRHQVDVLFWTAAQTGEWYGQDHRALAATGEAGLQWTAAPWKPWVRGGYTHASGDDDPADDGHGTFFQILPTVRKYSLSATYAVMNLNDAFVQLLAAPRPALSIRADVHRLTLADASDRWYFGSGATQASGTVFGYATRLSQGHRRLGTILEGSADYRFNRRWSINGYLGVMRGGDVVAALFAGRTLAFGYLENVIQF